MKKHKSDLIKKIIIIKVVLLTVIIVYLFVDGIDFYENDVLGDDRGRQEVCESVGGSYTAQFTCDEVTENQCNDIGGSYNGCASSCNTDEPCITLCIQRCQLP